MSSARQTGIKRNDLLRTDLNARAPHSVRNVADSRAAKLPYAVEKAKSLLVVVE